MGATDYFGIPFKKGDLILDYVDKCLYTYDQSVFDYDGVPYDDNECDIIFKKRLYARYEHPYVYGYSHHFVVYTQYRDEERVRGEDSYFGQRYFEFECGEFVLVPGKYGGDPKIMVVNGETDEFFRAFPFTKQYRWNTEHYPELFI